jgi:hypothetical protein
MTDMNKSSRAPLKSGKGRVAAIGRLRDMGVAAVFVSAVAALLLVAMYVIARLESDRAYRAKWQDYNDCGWA